MNQTNQMDQKLFDPAVKILISSFDFGLPCRPLLDRSQSPLWTACKSAAGEGGNGMPINHYATQSVSLQLALISWDTLCERGTKMECGLKKKHAVLTNQSQVQHQIVPISGKPSWHSLLLPP